MGHLEERIKDLEEQLAYFQTRGQVLLDLIAQRCLGLLQKEEITAAELNVVRQLLRDQGIVDLKNGGTPVDHLRRNYPFSAKDDGDAFSVKRID